MRPVRPATCAKSCATFRNCESQTETESEKERRWQQKQQRVAHAQSCQRKPLVGGSLKFVLKRENIEGESEIGNIGIFVGTLLVLYIALIHFFTGIILVFNLYYMGILLIFYRYSIGPIWVFYEYFNRYFIGI